MSNEINYVTVTAPGQKPVQFELHDVSSIKTPAKNIELYGNNGENYTIDAGKNYNKYVEFFTNVRDANLSDNDRKMGKHDGVINGSDYKAFASEKRKIPGYDAERAVEFSVFKNENGKSTFEIVF